MAGGYAYVLDGLLQNGKRFQTEKVHLYQSRRLNHVAVILRAVQLVAGILLVVGRRDGHPVAYRVAADDEAAGMYARAAHRALKHLGIGDGVVQLRVGTCLGVTQLRDALDGIGKVHLQPVGQLVGDGLAQLVRYV